MTVTFQPTDQDLRRAFALFPSGVAVVTVVDRDGIPHGFTASSFVPLSLDPPMVLVCLNRQAQCYDAFVTGERLAISLLRPEHEAIARRFATRAAEKFAQGIAFLACGLPVIDEALATFSCRTEGRHPGGDHVILTGRIEELSCTPEGAAMVHFDRKFRQLAL